MENNVKNSERSVESLSKENFELRKEINSLKKNRRWERLFYWVVIIILIILLFKNCKGRRDCESNFDNYKNFHNEMTEDLMGRIHELENRKAVLDITDTLINGSPDKYVVAVIVPLEDNRPSSALVKANRVSVPYKVEVPAECPVDSSAIFMLQDCADANKRLAALLLEMDSLLSDSIKVCLDKQYRDVDSSRILYERNIQLRQFILNPPPSINYSHKYIEYLPNPYRLKAENSFKRAIISGIVSAGLYATSEALGHPKYWDNMDNSDAERKSNWILGLRIGSGVAAAYSGFEFGRTIYFHHMEGKFIVDPTTIGLILYLDRSGNYSKK